MLLSSNFVFSQFNDFDNDPKDLDGNDTGGKSDIWMPFGNAFTPKDELKVLVVFAGFENEGLFTNPEDENWPVNYENEDLLGLPTYVNPETGEMPDILFSNISDFTTVIQQNPENTSISRYYNDMSLGNFKLTAEAFKVPGSNKPLKVNIDPSDYTSGQWSGCNKLALQKIKEMYPDYNFSSYLSQFDNRKNNPNYNYDNSSTLPDNKVDYIVFIWRYSPAWGTEPIIRMRNWNGSAGGVTGSGTDYINMNGYTFPTGFKLCNGVGNKLSITETFIHETAHMIFSCPHVMGANGCGGDKWTFSSGGWGMMQGIHYMFCTNGWERWLLGWSEIESNDEITDLKTKSDINETGIYTIRDFVSTGDVIRIKIPNTEDNYLWIENHQKLGVWEEAQWEGSTPSITYSDGSKDTIPGAEKGIYMYIDNTMYYRTSYSGYTEGANGLKILNAQGNYDYSHSDFASFNEYWGNPLYTFERQEENPISGINPFYLFPDNYPNDNINPVYDNEISYYNNYNKGDNEVYSVVKETNGVETHLLYGHTSGLNYAAKNVFNRRSDAFQVGDEISLSGIVPALNFPDYNYTESKIEPYILNGLSIKILSYNAEDHSFQIKIQFDDFEITESKRWTGNIELPNSSNNSAPDIILKTGNTLLINKGTIPNRHTMTAQNDFVNASVFTCKNNSYFKQETNTNVEVLENSSLIRVHP